MDALHRLVDPACAVGGSSPGLGAGGVTVATIATTAVVTVSLLLVGRAWLYPRRGAVIPGPLRTALPRLPKEAVDKLEYRPDMFPGARDVPSPYGSIRVYEFGTEDGPKVLLVHGISTSCMTLGKIADGLVARGFRVMMFDLFGRGFSDGVGDVPHDARLYVSQILCVLASSPLSWTGTGAIRVIGYSLGGGIAVHFANSFPNLVSSLILLAPAGLIRAANFGTVSRFVFSSGLVPERLLAVLTSRRLQQPIASSSAKAAAAAADVKEPYVEVAVAEAADPADGLIQPLEKRVLNYVRWMVIHHEGFVPAFMSSIRFAPLTDQHDAWRQLAKREPATTAILLARSDEIVDVKDYESDALPLVGGEDNVKWRVLPGGHDFVMTHTEEVMHEIDDFWGL